MLRCTHWHNIDRLYNKTTVPFYRYHTCLYDAQSEISYKSTRYERIDTNDTSNFYILVTNRRQTLYEYYLGLERHLIKIIVTLAQNFPNFEF